MLNVWCGFLGGPHSRAHLDTSAPDGWFCDAASKRIGLSQFQYRDDQPHGGFTSWNDFFTRRFRDGARPVAAPDDPHVIVSACEAAPYHVESNVKLRDRFWIKAQPYSLRDIFTPARLSLAERFVGGDLYRPISARTTTTAGTRRCAGSSRMRTGSTAPTIRSSRRKAPTRPG